MTLQDPGERPGAEAGEKGSQHGLGPSAGPPQLLGIDMEVGSPPFSTQTGPGDLQPLADTQL